MLKRTITAISPATGIDAAFKEETGELSFEPVVLWVAWIDEEGYSGVSGLGIDMEFMCDEATNFVEYVHADR